MARSWTRDEIRIRQGATQFIAQVPLKLPSRTPGLVPDLNGHVHQYTSLGTLSAATQGQFQSIWASSAHYMNDSQEFVQGHAVFQKVLEDFVAQPKIAGQGWKHDIVSGLLGQLPYLDGTDVFCACFTREGDHLGQWRGYGAGGHGCCISFDFNDLQDINGLCSWVVYDPGEQKLLAEELLEDFLTTVVQPVINNANCVMVCGFAVRDLLRLLPALFMLFKHPSFREEREYRVIYTDEVNGGKIANRGYRLAGSLVIPYVELNYLNLPEAPVKQVRLGPGCAAKKHIESVDRMVESRFKKLPVEPSSIPFLPS